jgi:hypothetical protein
MNRRRLKAWSARAHVMAMFDEATEAHFGAAAKYRAESALRSLDGCRGESFDVNGTVTDSTR